MKRVEIESPFSGDVERNVRYLRACMRDCLLRGEAPIASHALYTQPGVLDDGVPEERKLGMEAGKFWTPFAEALVVYTDLGISGGMEWGIERSKAWNISIEYRKLSPEDMRRVLKCG